MSSVLALVLLKIEVLKNMSYMSLLNLKIARLIKISCKLWRIFVYTFCEGGKKKSWFISNVLSVPKTTENVASYVHCTRGTHLTFWHFGLLKILDLAKIWSIKINCAHA